jgi:hypothetical protein
MDESSVGDEWNSGEEITVTLIDQDLNKNTLVDEDLLLVNTTQGHLVPSLQIGDPYTVTTADSRVGTFQKYSNITWFDDATSIGGLSTGGAGQNVTITTGYSGEDINLIDTVNTYFNFDFTSFNNTFSTSGAVYQVCLVNGTVNSNQDDVACGATFESKGIAEIVYPASQTGMMYVNVTLTEATTGLTTVPFVADVFSFGAGINNAIYRLQLEETGVNTATFEGTVEYTMLNQLNINTERARTWYYDYIGSYNMYVGRSSNKYN